jgi:trans-aconitate 2-methyltransferase
LFHSRNTAQLSAHLNSEKKIVADWNPGQYLKFEDERTRPSLDLLARVPLQQARHCIDIGCGPGNSTELLVRRFPDAQVSGLDSSPVMVAKAKERLPTLPFETVDVLAWDPRERYDLIFANAVFQWVPDHNALLTRLAGYLRRGGCLAVQMPNNMDEPSHRLMREIAQDGPWASKLAAAAGAKEDIGSFETYYRWLLGAGCQVDLWQTTYVHALDGATAIVEWFKSTGLKPFLDPLTADERSNYLSRYELQIADAYPAQPNGKVLLGFPRLFFIAQRL